MALGLVLLDLIVLGAASCLPEAIPASARINLTNEATGESFALGINVGASFQEVARGTSYILALLLAEVYGYNLSEFDFIAGAPAAAALAGCRDPANVQGCDGQEPRVHVALSVIIDMGIYLQDFKSRVPIGLGGMGFSVAASIQVPRAIHDAAVADGWFPGYYQNWNASWFDPAKYFDSFTAIPTSELTPCQDSAMGKAGLMAQYLATSQDTEGLHPNGTARCVDGFWFILPACRSNHSRCVPMVTATQPRALVQTLQKAAAFSMPLAVNQIMKDTVEMTVPFNYKAAYFALEPGTSLYVSLQSVPVEFPPMDELAWSKNDYRTMLRSSSTSAKFGSWNLQQLAPRVKSFVEQMTFPNAVIDEIMADKAATGDDWKEIACRWVLSHRDVWQSWVPDETVCVAGYGLYSSNTLQFMSSRAQDLDLTCIPCPSGRFSEEIFDDRGVTYICSQCPAGTYQPSISAFRCDPCPAGEYQNEVEGKSCKRCGIGFYQDQLGSMDCKNCSEGTTTVGRGALSQLECGCREGFIETARSATAPVCTPCQSGMSCPTFSTKENLETGTSEFGEGFVPQIEAGYMSFPEEPLSVFKCNSAVHCPGGLPGKCGGGRTSIACSTCGPDQYWQDEECSTCAAWIRVMWILVLCFVIILLPFSRYSQLQIKSPTASTLAFTILCIVEIGANLLQSMGIVGQMPLEWPSLLAWSFSFLDAFAFDIHELGFSCLVEKPLAQYGFQAAFMPSLVLWVIFVHLLLFAMPSRCSKRFAVKGAHLALVLGQIVMMCFEAVSNLSLVPFMCYKHPNGSHSNLQFANILCSSDDHLVMTLWGAALGLLVIAFLVACGVMLLKLPRWSLEGRTHFVVASQFLTDQFRPDAWWFGLVILLRGPVLSLIITIFTNAPPSQIMLVTMAMITYLVLLLLAWPYKLPLLNALEAACSWSILTLVLGGSLYLPPSDSEATDFSSISTVFALVFAMALVGSSLAVTVMAALGYCINRRERRYSFIDLGKLPQQEDLADLLKLTAGGISALECEILKERLTSLSPFDSRLVLACVNMLSLEVLPVVSNSRWLSTNSRVLSKSASLIRSSSNMGTLSLTSPRSDTDRNSFGEAIDETIRKQSSLDFLTSASQSSVHSPQKAHVSDPMVETYF